MSKPTEFWIKQNDYDGDLVLDAEEVYLFGIGDDFIHVIEYSAFEKAVNLGYEAAKVVNELTAERDHLKFCYETERRFCEEWKTRAERYERALEQAVKSCESCDFGESSYVTCSTCKALAGPSKINPQQPSNED